MSEQTTERTVAPKQLLALIHEANQKKSRMQSISGELGERIKEAVENGHLNRKAFGLVSQLDRQDEDKRNDNIRAIRLYLDICDKDLWGDGHIGDFVDEAAKAKAAEDDAMAENAKNAAGIKGTTPEQEATAKRRPGRPKKAEANGVEHEVSADDALRNRGQAAFKAGEPGMIPPDLEGKPREANLYLEGWGAASKASFDADQPGGKGVEAFEDDGESDRPSIIQGERRETLPGADAPGSYEIRH